MGRRWLGCVPALSRGVGLAGGAGAVRKRIESSRRVTGTTYLRADGSVAGFELDGRERLEQPVVDLIGQAVPRWRFEPVTLAPGASVARAEMSLRLVAHRPGNGSVMLSIRSAHFGREQSGEVVSSQHMTPPTYPEDAMRAGVGGTVHVAARIGRDGRVVDAIAEQVDLRIISSEPSMRRWRARLAGSAVNAARKWTFFPPTRGPEVDAPGWAVRIPVDFVAPDMAAPSPYEWNAYVLGPRLTIPGQSRTDGAADAVAAGSVQPLHSDFGC